jgi:hypothetical protein
VEENKWFAVPRLEFGEAAVELGFLSGRARLENVPVASLVRY